MSTTDEQVSIYLERLGRQCGFALTAEEDLVALRRADPLRLFQILSAGEVLLEDGHFEVDLLDTLSTIGDLCAFLEVRNSNEPKPAD